MIPLIPGLLAQRLYLLDRFGNSVGDRYQSHPGTSGRVGGTELFEPTVVSSGAGPGKPRVGDHPGLQPCPEGRCFHSGHCVAVGEDYLPGYTVCVEGLVTDLGVICPFETDFVLPFPLLDVFAVEFFDHRPLLVASLQPLVELGVHG